MNRFATKFAASTMVIAVAMGGWQSDSLTSTAVAAGAERTEQQAGRLANQAREALQRGEVAQALQLAERAVEMAPRDAGYRMLLADLYLKNGRFRSAETSYSDVMEIDGSNVRAGLSAALAQIAQGRSGDALVTLEDVQERAPAADVGLALALAGQPQRAIQLLEPAARAADATGRTRQNLALAYALAGDWQRARTVAAQDVAPSELGARLQHWAGMARPAGQQAAVATLLGVTPVDDPGQPVRLALNAAAEAPVAYAEAEAEPVAAEAPIQFAEAEVPSVEAAPEVVVEAPVAAPVETIRYAEAPVVVAPAPVMAAAAPVVQIAAAPVVQIAAAPAPAPVAQSGSWWPAQGASVQAAAEPVSAPVVTAPVRTAAIDEAPAPSAVAAMLSAPSPVLARTVAPARTSRPVFAPAPVRRAVSIAARIPRAVAGASNGAGNYVVQLGAFANPANAERAWTNAKSRYGLSQAQGRTASINVGGRQLTRVSVAGFANRAAAVSLCASIQGQGGTCFVRGTAGDAPVRWASRPVRGNRA